ncbi:MAG: MFS transporter [Acetobacterium sp.]
MEIKNIKFAIMSISSLILISMTASAILADVQAHFAGVDGSIIQMVLTIPALLGVIFAFASGPLSMRMPKKNLVLLGLIFGLTGGVVAFFFGSASIVVLLFCSVQIGVAQGINSTMSMALIADYFIGDESNTMMGYQSAFLNGGSMVLIFTSGLLASIDWHYSYLVYFAFVPIIYIVMKNLPTDDPTKNTGVERAQKHGKLNSTVYFVALLMFLLGTFMFVFQTNISLLVVSKGYGDASLSGMINTTISAAGMVTGILYGRIQKLLKHLTMPLALLMASLGMFLVFYIGTLPMLFIAAICLGFSLGSFIPAGTFIAANTVTREMAANAIALVTAAINLGMFISPIILNGLSNSLDGGSITYKFMVSAMGLLGAGLVALIGNDLLLKEQNGNDH